MGFWGGLGKIASIAGPLAAIPFTGGASALGMLGMGAKTAATLGGVIGAAGKVAGGISQGRAAGRVQEAGVTQRADEARNAALLRQAQLKMLAERQRTGQLAGADLSSSMHAPTDPRISKYVTGGGLSPETIQMIRSRATNALQSGSDVPALQNTPLPQAGRTDSILNALSLGGTVTGALSPFLKKRDQPDDDMPDGGWD